MASKNPYDAPVPRTLKADDATEVALASKGTVLPVDDETNFGPLKGKKSVLAPEALAMDPRALAKKLSANAGRLPPTRTPTPRSRRMRPDRPAVSLLEDEPTVFSNGPEVTTPHAPEDAPVLVHHQPDPEPAPRDKAEPTAPAVDPRELARQLAAEAKRRIQQQEASSKPSEDPAALARRLAAEAKARIQAEEQASAPQETPAELARRLAAETRARIAKEAAEAPPPEPTPAPPEPVARAVPEPEPAPEPARPRTSSGLAARAPRSRAPQSAQQALEALKESTPAPAPVRMTRRNPVPPEASVPPPEPAPKVERAAPAPSPSPVVSAPPSPVVSVPPAPSPAVTPPYLASLMALLPTASIERERPVLKHGVFKALWEAHQARAVKDNQLELAAAATVLLARIQQRSPGDIMGVQLTHQGTSWASFVDRTTGEVLALVPRPAIYLAGLQ